MDNTPFTPTRRCCRSRRLFYPRGLCTVSVLCLWIFTAIRHDPQPSFESDFMFQVCYGCCGLSHSVLPPPTLSTVSVLSPPTKLRCISLPNLRREYGYSMHTVQKYVRGQYYVDSTDAGIDSTESVRREYGSRVRITGPPCSISFCCSSRLHNWVHPQEPLSDPLHSLSSGSSSCLPSPSVYFSFSFLFFKFF